MSAASDFQISVNAGPLTGFDLPSIFEEHELYLTDTSDFLLGRAQWKRPSIATGVTSNPEEDQDFFQTGLPQQWATWELSKDWFMPVKDSYGADGEPIAVGFFAAAKNNPEAMARLRGEIM